MRWSWIRKWFMPNKQNKPFPEVSKYTGRAARSFEQLSSLFLLTSKNDSVFLGRLLFCKTKHIHTLQGWGGSLCEYIKLKRPAEPSARGAQTIHPGWAEGGLREAAASPSSQERFTAGFWLFWFCWGFFLFFSWASISNDLFRCKQWQL